MSLHGKYFTQLFEEVKEAETKPNNKDLELYASMKKLGVKWAKRKAIPTYPASMSSEDKQKADDLYDQLSPGFLAIFGMQYGESGCPAGEKLTESASNRFVNAYIECALWSSTDESTPSGGEPLDKNYGPEDLDSATRSEMKNDCNSFVQKNEKDLAESGLKDDRAGHDFWLNRNGHGAGFWDEGDDPVFKKLSDACKSFGTYDLYVGDDGKIHGGNN